MEYNESNEKCVCLMKGRGVHSARGVWESVKYEAGFFALLLAYFQSQVPSVGAVRTDGWWLGGFWYVTYDLGFISRGLAGSVVSLFRDRITPQEMNTVISGCWLALAFCTALFCGWLVKRSSDRDRLAVLYLVTTFLVMPCSITQYCHSEMFGKLDLFHAPILLASAGLTVRGRALWLVPLLAAAGILIHPSFFFLYFPSLLFLVGYRTEWRKRTLLAVLTMAAVGLFVGLQFWGKPIGGADALAAYVTARSGVEAALNKEGFFYAYFATLSDQWALLVNYGARPIANACLVFLTVLAPVWLLPAYLWRQAIGRAEGSERKFLFLLCLGPFICAAPLFLALDWTRWFSSLVVCQFVVLLTLHAGGNRWVREAVAVFGDRLRQSPFLFGFVALWLAILPRAEVSGLLLNPGFTSLWKHVGLPF